jgi:hypothetical protein
MPIAKLHPFISSNSVRCFPSFDLQVSYTVTSTGAVIFTYTVTGKPEEISALRIPTNETPDPWPLWKHTCFEAFLSAGDEQRYYEYNFSPARLWAGSEFSRYREFDTDLKSNTSPPMLLPTRSDNKLGLTASVPRARLPGGPILKVGLSAVLESIDGQLEYWALHHPVSERPDFHHHDGWTLLLDVTGGHS